MGALPKNKITRAERGKRRAGNTPSLTKQTSHTTVPLHKRGIVNQVLQTLGLSGTTPSIKSKKSDKKATKVEEATENKAIQAKLARENSKASMPKATNKPAVRRKSLNKDA